METTYERSEFTIAELYRKMTPKIMYDFGKTLLTIRKMINNVKLPDNTYNLEIWTEDPLFFIGNLADNNGVGELVAVYPLYDDTTDCSELCRKIYGKVYETLKKKYGGIADFEESESVTDSRRRYGIMMRLKPQWRPVLNALYKRKYARYWW